MHTLRAPIDVPLLSGSATPLPQVCRPHVSAAPLADSSYHVAVDNTVCVVGSDVPLCMRSSNTHACALYAGRQVRARCMAHACASSQHQQSLSRSPCLDGSSRACMTLVMIVPHGSANPDVQRGGGGACVIGSRIAAVSTCLGMFRRMRASFFVDSARACPCALE